VCRQNTECAGCVNTFFAYFRLPLHFVALRLSAKGVAMSQAKQVEDAALAAALTITEVCRQAGVNPHTLYASRRTGRPMKAVTVAKLMRAIKELSE